MNQTIWKFPFEVADQFVVSMPKGAQVIHVGLQGAHACMWAIVNPKEPKVDRKFRVVGTGNPSDNLYAQRHRGTWFDGPFVWHLFEDW